MSFDTIWGNMEFPTQAATPAGVGKKEEFEPSDDDKDLDKKPEEEEKEEEEEEDKEKDNVDLPKTPENKDKDKPKSDAISYSDEDLDKAFALLDSQNVLDLDDDEEVDASLEGIAAAVASTIRKGVAKELSSAPESVKRLYEHLQSGGSEEDFEFLQSQEPWSEMNEDDEDNQKLAFTQMLINQGMTLEEAEEEVEDAASNGKLDKKSILAFKSLIKLEEDGKLEKQKNADKARKLAEENADKEIEQLKTKIKGIDSIAGFKMTEDRKKSFEDYLFKIDKKSGKTQLQLNMSDEDRKLKIAFMDFVEFNQADITKEVETDLTKTRKRMLTRHSGKNVANTNSSKTVNTQTKNTGKIVFPSIFSPKEK